MPLSTLQFNKITLEYENRQRRMREKLLNRENMIYERVPRLKTVRSEIIGELTNIALCKMRKKDIKEHTDKLYALRAEEDKLLRENSIDKKSFELDYICRLCKDTGFIDGKKCSCFKQMEYRLLYDSSNLKYKINDENFDNFSFDYYISEDRPNLLTNAKKAYNLAKRFSDNIINDRYDDVKNLFIYGSIGSGKTYLSHCIANELLKNGKELIYFSSIQLFNVISECTFDKEKSTMYSINDIYDVNVLIIDDLGTENTNDFVKSSLFGCINERLIRGKSTVISANYNIKEIAVRYDDRISSRIFGSYELLELFCPDIRVVGRNNQKMKGGNKDE